jgi:hypothetical protein
VGILVKKEPTTQPVEPDLGIKEQNVDDNKAGIPCNNIPAHGAFRG